MTGERSAPVSGDFAQQLRDGEASCLAWIRERCQAIASPQFSSWAWDWIQEDFVADLIAQLTSATQDPDFGLRSSTGAYVDTCIRNLCRRYFYEVARVRAGVPLDPEAAVLPTRGGDAFTRIAVALDLMRALETLSPRCRHLIQSKYVLGATLVQIGEELGIEEKTARSRLHTCRERLRQILRRGST